MKQLLNILLFTILLLCQGCISYVMGIKPYHHHGKHTCQDIPVRTTGLENKFIIGLSDYGRQQDEYLRARELGVRFMRLDFPWKDVMPVLEDHDLVTEEQLKFNPQWIEDLIRKLDRKNAWSAFDRKIVWAQEQGIEVMPIIGHGYQFYLPSYKGKVLSPELIGREKYLGTTSLFVRAFTRHYAGKFKYYQIENELNVAGPTMLWGWRLPNGIEGLKNGAFSDWKFLGEIIRMLANSIKAEHPEALLTHNFQTDLSPKLLHALGQPSWTEAVELWRNHLDIIGIDLYPNYYDGEKPFENIVQERVALAQKFSCGRPVIILETNYPRGPNDRQFDIWRQAEYTNLAINQARTAGAKAIFFYGAVSLSYKEDSVKFSTKDKKLLRKLGNDFERGSLLGILSTLLFNQAKLKSGHLSNLLTSVEPYWDFFDDTGSPMPAYYVLKEAQKN